MENKKEIVEKLYELIKVTRFGGDIDNMTYDDVNELILINDGEHKINVACDSGAAMIIDFSKWLREVL